MIQSISNGRTTRIPAQKIIDKVLETPEGQTITHDVIEQLVGESRSTHRYRTIIHAAKRKLLTLHNLALEAEPGIGYLRVNGAGQIRLGVTQTRRAVRSIGRAYQVVVGVHDDRLPDPKDRAARDHFAQNIEAIHASSRNKMREISLGVPVTKVLPKM